MQASVITMVYNEADFLPKWIEYYGRNVGVRNLLVVNHGSNDGSISKARRSGAGILNLPRTEFDEERRADFISRLHASLLNFYDLVLYTDCDEFLVPDPDSFPTLQDWLKEAYDSKCNLIAPVGIDVIHSPSTEQPIDFSKPILGQRRYCYFSAAMCKPLISRIRVNWHPGFHGCTTNFRVDENLFLFHMKRSDLALALKRLRLTRNLLWSENSLAKGFGLHQRISPRRLTANFAKMTSVLPDCPAEDLRFHALIEAAKIERDRCYTFSLKVRGPLISLPEKFYGLV